MGCAVCWMLRFAGIYVARHVPTFARHFIASLHFSRRVPMLKMVVIERICKFVQYKMFIGYLCNVVPVWVTNSSFT